MSAASTTRQTNGPKGHRNQQWVHCQGSVSKKKQTMQLRRNTEEQQNNMNPSKLCGNLFLKMNVKKKVHTVC